MRRVAFMIVLALAVSGCNGALDLSGPESTAPNTVRAGLLPPGTTVDSAHLILHVVDPGGPLVAIHPYQAGWDEGSVTWNDVGPYLSPFVVATFSSASTGTVEVDVSPMVSLWIDSIWVNEGMILDQNAPDSLQTQFGSREMGKLGPELRLYCTGSGVPPVVSLRAQRDAYICEANPASNGGDDTVLISGSAGVGATEYRTLIRFDLDQPAPVSSVGDFVWHDLNANGIQDEGEPGLADVVVNLIDCSGALLDFTMTGLDGSYRFDSLSSGSYAIEFVASSGFVFSPANIGADPGLDSDADPATGRTACIDLSLAVDVVSYDAGLFLPTVADTSLGCTHGKGWWKHQARHGDTGVVAALLPQTLGGLVVSTPAEAYLMLHPASDMQDGKGLGKLLSHMLATKLNVAAGASSAEVAAALADAGAFLVAHGDVLWDELEPALREQVLSWKDQFEAFNEGEIGPGSCDDDGDSDDATDYSNKRGDTETDHDRAEHH